MPDLRVVLVQLVELSLLEEQYGVPVILFDLPELYAEKPGLRSSPFYSVPPDTHLLLKRSKRLPCLVRDTDCPRVVPGISFAITVFL